MHGETRVLHVEDSSDFADLTQTFLEREAESLDIVCETNGTDALDRLADESIDCVVSDYDMPGMNGIELLETVREDHPDLPFILFTGKGSEEVAADAIAAGVTDYLQKETAPDQYKVLANSIRNAVEQRQTEAELEREKRQHLTLFENFPEPTVKLKNEDGAPIVRAVNPVFETTFGVTNEEVVGESLNDLIVPEDRHSEAREFDRLATEHGYIEREVERTAADGTRDFLLRSVPVEGDVGFYGVYIDITERKQRERQLEAYRETLTALQDTAARLYAADTREECFEITIDAAVSILGFDWCTLSAPDDANEVFEIRAISEDAPLEVGETTFGVDEGVAGTVYQTDEPSIVNDIHQEEDATPTTDVIRSALTAPIGDWGVFQAVSDTPGAFDEQDLTNVELLVTAMLTAIEVRDHQASLERKNQRLEAFAKFVSHDLRAPLNVAKGRIDLASREYDSDHLDAAQRAHDRMAELIDDLLTLAQQGTVVEETEPVNLATLTETTWSTVDTADATLHVDVTGSVQANRSRLQELLENLFRNAIRHAGPDCEVVVGTLQDGFYVADDGPGIPEADRSDVLQSGYSTTDQGTGLGLTIVSEIAAGHDWTLDITTSADGGARFELHDVGTLD